MPKIVGDAMCFIVMEITSMEKKRLPGNENEDCSHVQYQRSDNLDKIINNNKSVNRVIDRQGLECQYYLRIIEIKIIFLYKKFKSAHI